MKKLQRELVEKLSLNFAEIGVIVTPTARGGKTRSKAQSAKAPILSKESAPLVFSTQSSTRSVG
ncbi:MAG TPA: hypothetical protein VM821_01095 [Abditibacteriaceae bacterium]|nr:hypothetical protein [Abditibacteriaceae bacterium]